MTATPSKCTFGMVDRKVCEGCEGTFVSHYSCSTGLSCAIDRGKNKSILQFYFQPVKLRGKDLPGAINVLPAGLGDVLKKRESREFHSEVSDAINNTMFLWGLGAYMHKGWINPPPKTKI